VNASVDVDAIFFDTAASHDCTRLEKLPRRLDNGSEGLVGNWRGLSDACSPFSVLCDFSRGSLAKNNAGIKCLIAGHVALLDPQNSNLQFSVPFFTHSISVVLRSITAEHIKISNNQDNSASRHERKHKTTGASSFVNLDLKVG